MAADSTDGMPTVSDIARAPFYYSFVFDHTDPERHDHARDGIDPGADPEAAFLDFCSGGGTGIGPWLERANGAAKRAGPFMRNE
jgi:hypothetical protein